MIGRLPSGYGDNAESTGQKHDHCLQYSTVFTTTGNFWNSDGQDCSTQFATTGH